MSQDSHPGAENQMNIEIDAETAEGVYSNLAMIAHSNAEFIVDFVRLLPGIPSGRVKSRIILAPIHFKRLALAINENLAKYEANHGMIHIGSDEQSLPPSGNSNFIVTGQIGSA